MHPILQQRILAKARALNQWSRLAMLMALLATGVLGGCATVPETAPEHHEQTDGIEQAITPGAEDPEAAGDRAEGAAAGRPQVRWAVNEVPYEEAPLHDRIGRNVRDGLVGMINNVFEAAFSGAVIATQTGYVVQKGVTFAGDVVGLIDDNPWTEHVFKGVISRQLLKFGSRGQGFANALGGIHETRFEAPRRSYSDYVGPEAFHVRAYGAPSGIVTLGAVIVGDLMVRPAGNFITIFGFRESGAKLDQAGLDLIDGAMDVNFI